MRSRATAIFLPMLLAAACSFRPSPPRESVEQRLIRERSVWSERFHKEQARVDWDNRGPRIYDSKHGTVIVRDWRLFGQPDEEFLRLFFTYDNSTFQTFDRARVWVKVHDPDGTVVASRWQDLAIAWYDFAPGNTYTTVMRVPTRGAHWQEGWYWTVGCSAHRRAGVLSPVPVGLASY